MLLGSLLAAVGVYASLDKWRSGEGFKLDNVVDVLLNVSLLLVIVGGIVFFVSEISNLFEDKALSNTSLLRIQAPPDK